MQPGTPDKIIGHYRIGAKLGEGGMGEVWQATDTRLNREVAIKILPAAVAGDAIRLARFTREAQVLASLNHPGIASIYGVEERALVMELVEGPTLAERIARGPMSWQEAQPIAQQIADALAYAHDHGVIHRDLKPANIKLTSDGQVKLLDFGLAKAISSETTSLGTAIDATTMSLAPTQAGQILGTAAYMAPEQARGQNVDKRADIWAYGVVLYEMLTGERPFGGPTMSDTLASVLTATPNLSQLPNPARRLLTLCLEKDPRKRLRDVGDGQIILAADEPPAAAAVLPRPHTTLNKPAWGLIGVVISGLAIFGLVEWRHAHRHTLHTTELSLPLPSSQSLDIADGPSFAISPDGSKVAYAVTEKNGQTVLWVRRFDQTHAVSLHVSGTAPFFSPHGHWVGFFSGYGKLDKISFYGGAPVVLARVNGARGAWWSRRGYIVYTRGLTNGLYRISSNGGASVAVKHLNPTRSQVTLRWPQVLPGGKAVLYTASDNNNDFSNADIEAASLTGGHARILASHAYFGRYLKNGYLAYISEGKLFAAPFDVQKLQLTGPAVPILTNIQSDLTNGSAQFDVSGNGTAIYLTGPGASALTTVDLVDRKGNAVPLISTPGTFLDPRFSPHGKRLLLQKNNNIDFYDPATKTLTPLTFNHPTCIEAIWSPGGRRVACTSPQGVGWLYANGTGGFHLWNPRMLYPLAWAANGKALILGSNQSELWSLQLNALDQANAPRLFLGNKLGQIGFADLSPDGHWLAYSQNVSGQNQVFVTPYPSLNGQWQVSTTSGIDPHWSRTGHTLYFVENRVGFNLYAVPYSPQGGSFTGGVPRLVVQGNYAITAPYEFYSPSPDGRNFAVLAPLAYAGSTGTSPTVVLHWFRRMQKLTAQ